MLSYYGREKMAVHLYYIPLPNYEIAVKEVNTMKH
jgi:hypothetical protein